MIGVVATQLTTPDTTRSYTVTIGPHDVTGDVQWDSLVFEDQGSSAQGTLELRVNGALSSYSGIRDQQWVEVVDHMAGGNAFRGFVDSRRPARLPEWNQIEIIASSHDSLLDNVIPFETRAEGESDRARIGYLWGLYATGFLAADLTYVQQVSASLPAQIFAGVTLRQAIDMIAAQASSSAFFYLDAAGRPHYGTSESNDAPKNVTSDTPGAGEIAPMDLDIDFDSKGYIGAVYVRGKTDAGSGWVYSESSKATHNGLVRTGFFDAPDCTTSTMRDNLGRMYLGRVGSALSRGSFSSTSKSTDGWRAGQNVTVRSSHLGNINASYRIARVRTSVLGPLGTRPAGLRNYEVEFGSATGSRPPLPPTAPVMGTGIVGDILDENGNLLMGSGSSATTSGFGPAIRRYITSNVYNGDFALTPPYPDSTIVQAWNPLPFWTFTQASGTSITAQSVADSGSGSGRVLQFDMAAGAAGDDSYFEQIIPINSSQSRAWAYRFRLAWALEAVTGTGANFYLQAQYLKADLTTTGTESTFDGSDLDLLTPGAIADTGIVANAADTQDGGQVPADAYLLRVRFGVKRDTAATSATATVTVHEAYMIVGGSGLSVADISDPTLVPARIQKQAGILYIAPTDFYPTPSVPNIQLDAATNNRITLAGQTLFGREVIGTPSATQTLVAATAITPNALTVAISSAAPVTITAAPTVTDGVASGQLLTLLNVGANAITIQDQGTLASSNIRLSTATFAIGPRDNITLLYNATIGDWVEIARTNVI